MKFKGRMITDHYQYDNEEEEEKHRKRMEQDGWAVLPAIPLSSHPVCCYTMWVERVETTDEE